MLHNKVISKLVESSYANVKKMIDEGCHSFFMKIKISKKKRKIKQELCCNKKEKKRF